MTRYYDFTITRGVIAPDGVNKSSLLINNQYPGVSVLRGLVIQYAEVSKPLIEANWGDYIQVLLNNQIVDPEEGTTLNWYVRHGLVVDDCDYISDVLP